MSEPLNRLLADLPTARPDPARAERVRLRCRAKLARQAPRESALRVRTAFVWRPIVVTLGLAYLIEVVVQAVSVLSSPP